MSLLNQLLLRQLTVVSEVYQVAESIKEYIRTHENGPEKQTVRRDARMSPTEPGLNPTESRAC